VKKLVFGIAAVAALIGTPVLAADMAVKARPVPVTIYSWTGFYVGIVGGYATGPAHADPTGILPLIGAYPVDFTVSGGFIGGQLGYDYQLSNRLVFGVVADIAWADLNGKACAEVTAGRCTGAPRDSYAMGKVKWLATARGRVGVVVGDNGLLYATGGAAFAGTRAEDTFIDGVNNITADATLYGWTVGVGGQYKLTSSVSLGLEYLYADFGRHSYVFNSSNLGGGLAGQPISVSSTLALNIIKASVSLHF
jgi:outer membrane immunogenic protein